MVELLFGHLAHRRVAGDPGIVHHDVQATEMLDSRPEKRLDLFCVSDIAARRHCDVLAAESFCRIFCAVQIYVAEHHSGALGDEPLSDGETQSLRSTCDDRDLTLQQRHLITCSSNLSSNLTRIANIIFDIGPSGAAGVGTCGGPSLIAATAQEERLP